MSRALARPVAVALVRRGGEILVFPVPDPVKDVTGWRLPGGTIEFGERGHETVKREIREELGVDIVEPTYRGTVENIFTYLGVSGHELVRVYEARFADTALYDRARFECIEADGARFVCVWKPLADFRLGEPLYPDGLLELIS
ncbi:MAG TPA: NUDIX domain-containing protein [Candidatus Limnocylindria bacterium]|nr:NUDIX domain-containing protein [Candidatus Limnocylindria bacterium]